MDSPLKLMQRFSIFTIGPVFSAFLGFILVPITTWFVSPEEFGKAALYTVVISITNLISILGLDQAFVREFYVEKDKVKLLQNSALLPMIISTILFLIIIFNIDLFSVIIFGEVDRISVIFMSFVVIISVFQRFNQMLVRSLEKGWAYSFNMILEKIINLIVLIILLTSISTNFTSIVVAQALALIVATLFLTYINREYWFGHFNFDKSIIKKTLKYGIPLAPAVMLTFLLSSIDKVFLRSYSTFYEVGIYTAAFKLVAIVVIIQTAFGTFWTPTSLKWFENKVSNTKFSKMGHLITTICILIFGIIVLFKDWIILILDKSYLGAAIIVPFLLFGPISEIMMQITGKGITFSRKTQYHLVSSGIAGLSNVVLNYILIPSYGAIGAAVATGISFIILFWTRTLISRKLWYQFKLGYYILSIGLMLTMATTSVLINSFIIDSLFFVIILFISRKDIFYIIKLFISTFKQFKKEGKIN